MLDSEKILKPTEKTYRLLYAKSGNQCAFPKCRNPISDGKILLGQVAHIKAENPGGPRYDSNQTPEERRSYENLVLLCGVHHKFVDDDPEAYTVERLLKMKANHEASATKIDDKQAERVAEMFVQDDINVIAINPNNSITAGVFHQTINHYGGNTTQRQSLQTYSGVKAAQGMGRFRKKGKPLGRAQSIMPFDMGVKREIFDEEGSCFWFRLLPHKEPDREWTAHELEVAAGGETAFLLDTIRGLAQYRFTASDGIGRYISINPGRACSATFLFRTGEIWSLDTYQLENLVALSEIRKGLPNLVQKSVQVLQALRIPEPF
jgi:hypothetical protein